VNLEKEEKGELGLVSVQGFEFAAHFLEDEGNGTDNLLMKFSDLGGIEENNCQALPVLHEFLLQFSQILVIEGEPSGVLGPLANEGHYRLKQLVVVLSEDCLLL